MPLTVATNAGSRPVPQIVSRARVVREARALGHPNADRALAVTSPLLRIDQTGLHYDQRRARGQVEFRFRTGTVRLTLRQSVYIDNALSGCAQGIWAQHEQDHVRDNQAVLRRMERRIRAHRSLHGILLNPRWHPRASFNTVQNRIQTTIGDIFRDLTAAEARPRDTIGVYRQVNRRILRSCPEPYRHTVERGETLSHLALYFYGRARLWPSIYRANRRVIGANPDLIYPGQTLVIPKRP